MASLHIVKGVNQGQDIPLAVDEFVLGREPKCDLYIPITSVSRQHAQIVRVNDRFYIEDLKSRNGTKVNDSQISGRVELQDKDQIQICDFVAKG